MPRVLSKCVQLTKEEASNKVCKPVASPRNTQADFSSKPRASHSLHFKIYLEILLLCLWQLLINSQCVCQACLILQGPPQSWLEELSMGIPAPRTR